MRRLHVIDNYDHAGVYFREDKFAHDPELLEAYHCGHKDGRKEAYKEIMEEQYGERRYGRTYPPMFREHDREWDEDDEIIKYRRGRNGRYI